MTQVFRAIKTDSDFIEVSGEKITMVGEEWFHCPFWFKKIKDGLYIQYSAKELPDYIKNMLATESINKQEG